MTLLQSTKLAVADDSTKGWSRGTHSSKINRCRTRYEVKGQLPLKIIVKQD